VAKFLTNVAAGTAPLDWRLITGWGSLNGSGDGLIGIASSAVDGTVTLDMPGDTTQIDGYQENWAGYDVSLLSLYPDWDDSTDELELLLEIASMPLTTAKYGMWFGLIDSAYADRATANGVGITVYPNSTTITQTSQTGATSNSSATNNGTNLNVIEHIYQHITWTAAGVARTSGMASRFSDTQDVTIAGTASVTMGAAANRRICIGHVHVSAVSGALTLGARVYVRRIKTKGFTHAVAPRAKPTLPTNMIVLGHSIANGVGANDGVYGGAAISGDLTVYDAGAEIANWPDNNGTGPDPGVLPWWGETIGTGTIIRQASNGAVLGQVESTLLPASVVDCAFMAMDRNDIDLVVLMIGENDAQNGGEATAYSTRLEQTCQLVEAAYPNARVVIQDMVTSDAGGYSEFASIRTTNATVAAAKSTRALAARTDITLNDTVHYDLAGYEQAQLNQLAAWQTCS
jgi:lysophospholipase L1-like esterase